MTVVVVFFFLEINARSKRFERTLNLRLKNEKARLRLKQQGLNPFAQSSEIFRIVPCTAFL